LTFTPRVREALQLHALADLHAMIDISDGLARDVNHICEESRCGAILRAEAIPITAEARTMNDSRSPLEHALSDGEDFELVFALPPAEAHRVLEAQPIAGLTLVRIGECVDQGLWLEEDGHQRPLEPLGYIHALQ
jgi:thiamine-monophosphate kinase